MNALEPIAMIVLAIWLCWRSVRWLRGWRRGEQDPRSLLWIGMGWVVLIAYGNQNFLR